VLEGKEVDELFGSEIKRINGKEMLFFTWEVRSRRTGRRERDPLLLVV
jgi:hypothetical protein